MKKYILLTQSIMGYTGAPRYVNNKCRFLKEQGWEVYVFWSYGTGHAKLEHLMSFEDKLYNYQELNYYPCWYTSRHQKTVCKKVASLIGTAEQIVVESNNLKACAWGELLAQKINAKHICFVTSEHVKIQSKDVFDFCYAKLKRGEFFTINRPSVNYIFSKYTIIQKPENYYWSASQGVEVKEYSFPTFDNQPNADFIICHFGRSKGYFPYMIEELHSFFSHFSNKTFNLFFIGDVTDKTTLFERLSFPNVNIVFHPALKIVPLQIFTKTDVIIATAGCASLASYHGGKVISMDVNKNLPLGLMRYTTMDSNADSGNYGNRLSLSEWLTTLLIDKAEFNRMDLQTKSHSFDYQMQFIKKTDGCYFDTSKMRDPITRNDGVLIFLTRIGLFRLVKFMFQRRKRTNK